MLLPAVAFYVIFAYIPMYGITLAFKDFDYSKGILFSPWIGFENFQMLFSNATFIRAFRNTLLISFGRLLVEFPIPIVLALLLNEISKSKLKKVYQTVYTFPHFLSWVILSGIVINLFQDQGVVNQLMSLLGLPKNTVLSNSFAFISLIFGSNIWKEAGWSSILYLAAIAGISPELYEAARVDGANRFQQVLAITWPELKKTASVLLVLQVGAAMNGGFDQIFNMYNSGVYRWADIIDTFVYRMSFVDAGGFGFTTAVGLSKAVLNFALLLTANKVIAKLSDGEGVI